MAAKINKILALAREKQKKQCKEIERKYYEHMTTEQLEELVDGNPSDERIREIFASVGGLHLIDEGGTT